MTSQSDIDSVFYLYARSCVCGNRKKHCTEQCKKSPNRFVRLVGTRASTLVLWSISLLFTGALLTVFDKTLPASESNKAVQSKAVQSKAVQSKTETADTGTQTVFSALFRGVDSLLNYVDQTLSTDVKTRAYFLAERLEQTRLYTADGPDFSRPIGLIVQTDGQTLLPYYFFPVKENVRRLNNIVLLPQIYLPVKDEYGPTDRYQVRQDIPVLGGFHIFYWPLEPLLAREQNGWIWITTSKGLARLPKEPLDLLPGFHWKEGELFQMKFNAQHLPQPFGDGLVELARAAACDAPRAMWSEKKVGPDGGQWGNVCCQYALRALRGTRSLEVSCVAQKNRMTFTGNWQIDPQSDWARFFDLQVNRHGKYPTLTTMYPHEEIPKAFQNILLPNEEQKLLQTIQAARKVSRTPEWFWSFALPEEVLRESQRRGLITESMKFTPQSCSLVAEIGGAFFAKRIPAKLRSENEEKKKSLDEKKKRRKPDQFDITF